MTGVHDKLLSSSNTTPRIALGRLCRQIALTLEARPAASPNLDAELETALTQVRAQYGDASVSDADLREIFEIEQNRVADAAVLAELLAPRLAALLPKTPEVAAPTASAPSRPTEMTPRTAANQVTPRVPAVDTPGIADLIDGMLAQERKTSRKGPSRS